MHVREGDNNYFRNVLSYLNFRYVSSFELIRLIRSFHISKPVKIVKHPNIQCTDKYIQSLYYCMWLIHVETELKVHNTSENNKQKLIGNQQHQ